MRGLLTDCLRRRSARRSVLFLSALTPLPTSPTPTASGGDTRSLRTTSGPMYFTLLPSSTEAHYACRVMLAPEQDVIVSSVSSPRSERGDCLSKSVCRALIAQCSLHRDLETVAVDLAVGCRAESSAVLKAVDVRYPAASFSTSPGIYFEAALVRRTSSSSRGVA